MIIVLNINSAILKIRKPSVKEKHAKSNGLDCKCLENNFENNYIFLLKITKIIAR